VKRNPTCHRDLKISPRRREGHEEIPGIMRSASGDTKRTRKVIHMQASCSSRLRGEILIQAFLAVSVIPLKIGIYLSAVVLVEKWGHGSSSG
jgi:hypothetical protein